MAPMSSNNLKKYRGMLTLITFIYLSKLVSKQNKRGKNAVASVTCTTRFRCKFVFVLTFIYRKYIYICIYIHIYIHIYIR